MSPKRDKTVPQLVEKYRREYPYLERPLLRKLMRLENPQLFRDNPSNLKKLDRYLRKAFEKEEPSSQDKSVQRSIKNSFGFFDWLVYRSEIKKRRELELMARIAARMEAIESSLHGSTHTEYEEYLHKHRKKYGLE